MSQARLPHLSGAAGALPCEIAAVVASLLPISICFFYADLIFSGPWQSFLGQGVAMLLASGAAIAVIVARSACFRVPAPGGPITILQ